MKGLIKAHREAAELVQTNLKQYKPCAVVGLLMTEVVLFGSGCSCMNTTEACVGKIKQIVRKVELKCTKVVENHSDLNLSFEATSLSIHIDVSRVSGCCLFGRRRFYKTTSFIHCKYLSLLKPIMS